MSTQNEHVPEVPGEKEKIRKAQRNSVTLQTVREYLPQYVKADDIKRNRIRQLVWLALKKQLPDLTLQTIVNYVS
jgi:hypothetical protein